MAGLLVLAGWLAGWKVDWSGWWSATHSPSPTKSFRAAHGFRAAKSRNSTRNSFVRSCAPKTNRRKKSIHIHADTRARGSSESRFLREGS
uniref:Putative secreted protein n=1 Tax=Anopheles triannulatus TaxID=58253 RepID=A0A2M4B655_9DIPT